MTLPLLPLITSLGALLFEFSLAQYLAMAVGNSAFGYSFVVGTFLLAMGLGAWWGDKNRGGGPAAPKLVALEIALSAACLVSLPSLAWITGAAKGWSLGTWECQSMLCEAPGLVVAASACVWLLLVGAAVGAEIPLFLRGGVGKLGEILAADYTGAFLAGLVFPFLTLPSLGLFGTLAIASLCHATAALALIAREKNAGRWWAAALAAGLIAASAASLGFADRVERAMLGWITARSDAKSSEIVVYFRTRKQSVLLVEDGLADGTKDRRLYLDGYLQSSSKWNETSYHKAMVLPARAEIGRDPARVLILGGGDGLAAETVLASFPSDEITIVDFDGEMMERFSRTAELRALAPSVWSDRVKKIASDAFWFVRKAGEQWDLILVDFPHGVGDAAAAKVESWEFFRELSAHLSTRGRLVLHHERFGSEAERCVRATLKEAGYESRDLPVEPAAPHSEAMIVATYRGEPSYRSGQSAFRLPCHGLRRLGAIWLGS